MIQRLTAIVACFAFAIVMFTVTGCTETKTVKKEDASKTVTEKKSPDGKTVEKTTTEKETKTDKTKDAPAPETKK